MRWLLVGGWAVIVFGWFGVPDDHQPPAVVAGQLALRSPRAPQQNKFYRDDPPLHALEYLPVQLLALLAVVVAWCGATDWS